MGVRKRMMPLIKLVHPDMFAQHPPDVASTNSKSLKVCALCCRRVVLCVRCCCGPGTAANPGEKAAAVDKSKKKRFKLLMLVLALLRRWL